MARRTDVGTGDSLGVAADLGGVPRTPKALLYPRWPARRREPRHFLDRNPNASSRCNDCVIALGTTQAAGYRRPVAVMDLGVVAWLTDLDLGIGEVAKMVERAGLESLFIPEHTHVPVSRRELLDDPVHARTWPEPAMK